MVVTLPSALLIGKVFEVTSTGAGLGRKITNTIALLIKVGHFHERFMPEDFMCVFTNVSVDCGCCCRCLMRRPAKKK